MEAFKIEYYNEEKGETGAENKKARARARYGGYSEEKVVMQDAMKGKGDRGSNKSICAFMRNLPMNRSTPMQPTEFV